MYINLNYEKALPIAILRGKINVYFSHKKLQNCQNAQLSSSESRICTGHITRSAPECIIQVPTFKTNILYILSKFVVHTVIMVLVF